MDLDEGEMAARLVGEDVHGHVVGRLIRQENLKVRGRITEERCSLDPRLVAKERLGRTNPRKGGVLLLKQGHLGALPRRHEAPACARRAKEESSGLQPPLLR